MLPKLPCGEPFCLCTFILLRVGWISHCPLLWGEGSNPFSLPSFAVIFPLALFLTVVWGVKAARLERRFDCFTWTINIPQSQTENKEDKSKSRQTEAQRLVHTHTCRRNTSSIQ